MTTYTAIPNGDIDPDSPITTGLMTLMRDNPIAITEGSAGAPNITNAAMAAAVVDRAVLSTAVATQAGSPGASTTTPVVMDAYSFFPMIYMLSGGVDTWMVGNPTDQNDADLPRFGLRNNHTSARPYAVDWRYVIA